MLPRKTTDELDVQHASSTNAEQSDCTSGYFSAEIETERENIKNCYKKFKQNFCETIKRIDQYRTDIHRRKWKPSSLCEETVRRSISDRAVMRSPSAREPSNNNKLRSESGEGEERESPLNSTDSVPAMYGEEFVEIARRSESFTFAYGGLGQMRVYSPKEAFPSKDLSKAAEEIYYLGAVHLDQARVRSVLAHYPPPPEFYRLPPIEKAAYIFYVTVYRRNYNNVSEFHHKFNREYFKHICENDSDVTALWKICKSMKNDYLMKMELESRRTADEGFLEKSNDKLEEGNAMSELGSMDGIHDNQTINHSVISNEAPLKHRVAHAFVTFGYPGKMVTVNPFSSASVVQIDDVKTILSDPHSRRLIDIAQAFRGPLRIGETPTHSVLLYIERQIRRILGYKCSNDDIPGNEVDDCVLIWQLLRMLIQQQGRVTGPDLSRLLLETRSTSSGGGAKEQHSSKKPRHNISIMRQARDACETAGNAKSRISTAPDAGGYQGFINLLLEGHVTEAIDSAVGDELYADALIIARRVLAHDPAKLIEIEEQFFTTKNQGDPVVTLASVAASKPLPCLTSSIANLGCWHEHVAIILANLPTQNALNCVNVYDLGKFLAQRNHNCAADFCFLAAAVLTKVNPFEPLKENSDAGTSTKHIKLIHSEPADGRFEKTQCRFGVGFCTSVYYQLQRISSSSKWKTTSRYSGFSLSDFHATEIFGYATRLSEVDACYLSQSLEFQKRRIQYAQLIADFGGFVNDAFRYCLEIASYIRGSRHLLSAQELTDFCDLADRLKYAACASVDEMSSIRSLRAMEQERKLTLQSREAESGTLKTVPATCSACISAVQRSASSTPLPKSSPSQRFMTELDMAETSGKQMQTQTPICPGLSTPSPVVNSLLPEEDVVSQQSDIMEDYLDEAYITPSTSPILSSHQQSMNESVISGEANSCSSSNRSAEDVGSALQSNPDLSLVQFNTQTDPTSTASRNEQTGSHLKIVTLFCFGFEKVEPKTAILQRVIVKDETDKTHNSRFKEGNCKGLKSFFEKLKKRFLKAVPSNNEMILPEDKEPAIVWDSAKGRYVDTDDTDEVTIAPPLMLDAQILNFGPSGLAAARKSRGSRYYNSWKQPSVDEVINPPSVPVPGAPLPAQLFIPTTRDDAGVLVDPFSEQATMAAHEREVITAR